MRFITSLELIGALISLLPDIWNEECIPLSLIVAILNRGLRNDFRNHRGISLTPITSRVLVSIMLCRLTSVRGSNVLEQQTGFSPGRNRIDQIFTLRQLLKTPRSVIAVFLLS